MAWLIRLIPIVWNVWTANTRLKKDDTKVALVWIKMHKVPIVAYSETRLSLITSQLGCPIMLDTYTSCMCLNSWGRNFYERALVEVEAEKELVDSLVVAIPYANKEGHLLEMVKQDAPKMVDEEGFTQVTRKKKNKQPNKGIASTSKLNVNVPEGTNQQHVTKDVPVKPTATPHNNMVDEINVFTLKNSFESLREARKVLDVVQPMDNPQRNETFEDNDDDVEEDFMEQPRHFNGTNTNKSQQGASTPISNQRRALWSNLQTHYCYIRGRSWCLLGDFNVSLLIDDKSTGANAFFHPYRISNHTPSILRIPMQSPTRPRMFKFSNVLVQHARFKEIVSNEWQKQVSGFWMFKVVKRLKFLKKPLCKLLYDHVLPYFHKSVKSQASRNRIDSVMLNNGNYATDEQVPAAKELTLTLDDFRTIFHLPQANDNNHASFVPPPSFSDMVPFYKQVLGFTMELKTVSNFKIPGLLQPWQTLCKIFSKCLTTHVTGWDQPPLQIMQILYCFVNNIHVDYAELMWEGIYYLLHHPATSIPYPRFTKIIISHYMTIFPEISRRARDAYHNLQDDDIMKNIFNSGRNKNKVGMRIPPWMITEEMKLTEHYKMYAEVFGLDVPLIQSQPTESTQGTHRTTNAPRWKRYPRLVKEKVTEKVKKEVPAQVRDQAPVYLAEGLILKRKTTKEETDRLLSKAILQRTLILCYNNKTYAIWLALQMKFEKTQVPQTACRSSVVRTRDQDDPHDDAHLEGENSAKRQKTSEYEAYVSGELSSGQVNEEEPGPSTSGNQEQDDKFDFWTDSYASDDDEIPTKQRDEHQYHIDLMKNFLQSDIVWESRKEIIVSPHPRKITPLVQSCPEKIVLSLHKFPAIVFNDDDIEERTSRWVNKCIKKFNPYARYGVENWKNPHAKIFYIRRQKEPGRPKEEIYSNSKIVQVIKTFWELGHKHKFITEIVARRANDCIVSITEPDYKNLNNKDIEDMYH
ncbi:integrase, catalytic region, zinc finger, CCHC-type containing protein [Tanacetum coccineum]